MAIYVGTAAGRPADYKPMGASDYNERMKQVYLSGQLNPAQEENFLRNKGRVTGIDPATLSEQERIWAYGGGTLAQQQTGHSGAVGPTGMMTAPVRSMLPTAQPSQTLTNAVMPGATTLPAGVAGGVPASTGMNGGTSGFGTGTGLAGSEAALLGGLNQAQGQLKQYQQEGVGASQMQAALSGALGPEAQAQAFADFKESPGQDYLRDRSEQAILRNAAATGGLGGGNVLKALQGNAMGLAAQDFDNSFNRLGVTADRGYNANKIGADMTFGTGSTLAGGRTRAGERMADQYGSVTSALSQLQNQGGQAQADIIGQAGGNLANLLAGAGQTDAASLNQLATLLANISTGSGSQSTALPGIPGTQQSGGQLGNIGQIAMAAAALFSDARLKTNIRRIGSLASGVNVYRWDWNDRARPLVGNQPSYGVIAQEVPWASFEGPDGYLLVDYGRI